MKIFIGSDHAGFKLKEKIKSFLEENKITFEDLGTNSPESADYPDFIIPTAEKVSQTPGSLGIILGGSGQGEAIAANKVKGIRAATYYHHDPKIIKLSKEHNNANILSLGARFLTEKQALEAIRLWLKTPFTQDERHKRRIKKIADYEK